MDKNTENIENIDLIAKYLARETSMKEVLELENWIKQDTKNRELFDTYQKAWDHIDKVKTHKKINLEGEWAKLEKAVDFSDNIEDTKTIQLQARKTMATKRFLRIAAIFVFLAISSTTAFFFVNQTSKEQLVAEVETKDTQLPDGSKITLNVNSTLKYPKEFSGETRKVKLEGEAFFEIQPDMEKPFIVDAGSIFVKVVGTEFNISNYENDSKTEIIVKSGVVAVSRKNKDEEIILKEGEKAVYHKTEKKLEKYKNKDQNFMSWKTRKLKFNNDKLSLAIRKINKVYQSNIIISSESVKDCLVTSDFQDQELESVLTVLKAILPNIDIEEKGDKIIIKGKSCY